MQTNASALKQCLINANVLLFYPKVHLNLADHGSTQFIVIVFTGFLLQMRI